MFEKPMKLYGLLLVIVFVIFVGVIVGGDGSSLKKDQNSIEAYKDGWKVISYDSNCLTISNVLPEDLPDGTGIAFVTKFQFVTVKLDDNLIYEFNVRSDSKRETVGKMWHFVDLPKDYAGKAIEIELLNSVGMFSKQIPSIQIGNMDDLMREVIKNGLASLGVCVSLMLFGITICLVWFFQREKLVLDERFLCIGIIGISLSAWAAVDSQIFQILWGNQYELTIINSLMILMCLFPVIYLLRQSFPMEDTRITDGVMYSYLIMTCLALIGNLLGVLNIRNMFGFAIGSLVLCSAFVLGFLFFQVFMAKGTRRVRIIKSLVGCTAVVLTMVFDMICYVTNQSVSFIKYTKIVVFIYLVILALDGFRNSMNLLKTAKESEKMHSIAYQDALTCLGNRTAFLEKMGNIKAVDYGGYGIAMFDLNNLKHFNDVYGHSAGDYYIIISSEIIQDMFGAKGTIYRMGGDEFCAILKDCEKDEFIRNAARMKERLEQLKGPYINGEMEIAAGYERFDSEIDIDLNATVNRADALMYQNKMAMKQKAGAEKNT